MEDAPPKPCIPQEKPDEGGLSSSEAAPDQEKNQRGR